MLAVFRTFRELLAPGYYDIKDRRINNCRTSEGDSPIFVGRKLGQSPTYSFADPN